MNRSTQNLAEQFKARSSQGEVELLIKEIKHEHQMAAWAATGIPDETARRNYISRRNRVISQHQQRLSQLVGARSAQSLVQIALNQTAIEQTPTQKQQIIHTQALGERR